MGKNINGDRPTAFPLEQEKLPFTIPVVEEPRPKIAKLVAMITDRVPAKLKGVKGNDPEYWGLADLVTDEMADVALKMGVRKPKTIGQLMKLTKLEREPLQKLLDDMAWVGLIEYNWENLDGKNPNHEKRYVLPQFVPGSAEFFNMRRSQMDEHPQVAAFFERMTFLPLEKITPMVPPGGAGIGMHVIPRGIRIHRRRSPHGRSLGHHAFCGRQPGQHRMAVLHTCRMGCPWSLYPADSLHDMGLQENRRR